MKATSKIILIIYVLIISGFVIYKILSKEGKQNLNSKTIIFRFETYNINDGWGFDLYQNEKMIIRQVHIPAINGKYPFSTKADAEKIAALMTIKIQNNIFPPSISIKEIDSLNINYSP